jgi:hypothetical protein
MANRTTESCGPGGRVFSPSIICSEFHQTFWFDLSVLFPTIWTLQYFQSFAMYLVGRDSAVCIATRYRPGNESR